uniref:N-acetyltransferase domain-containing protein n=1 Tax=Anopheles funestus TaxID=62324 RepID=A0A182R1M3_ANOFN
MNTNSAMEPLRAASEEEIRQLIQIYEKRLPESVQFVLLLQNILRINTTVDGFDLEEASHRFQKTIYIPNNEYINHFATFVAISREEDQFVLINTLEYPPVVLTNALQKTNYIKWDHKPMFVIDGNNAIRAKLFHIVEERKLRLESWSECINFWMPREEAAKLSFVVPNEVELKPLQIEHGKVLNEWWPYRYKASQRYMESAIKHNGGLGLFDKTSGELVACVFKNDHDAVGHLYTVPDRNNRGYGSTLAKALTRQIAFQHKQHVHTFINEENDRSIRLFEKLGFTAINRTEWLITSSIPTNSE